MSYIQYDKKEHNTTVGMPELATVEPIDGDGDIAKTDITNTNDNEEALDEDVYAFILVAPVISAPFLYAFCVILIKFLIYGVLLFGIADNSDELHTSEPKVQAVKFLLIPVAVAMQEDLIHVYAYAANLKYDEKVLKVSPSATRAKLVLSMLLRVIDGMLSLSVNFLVMLQTHASVRQVFLNFAALHFLQSIDDVFFLLLQKGFFGDAMEHLSSECTKVAFPRRKTDGFTKKFDTILFTLTLVALITIYGIVTARPNPDEERFGSSISF
jgi:hypothetical protein